MEGPLKGVRIIDLTHAVAGPMATMILADQGADVIKVEPPHTGDLARSQGAGPNGLSPIFVSVNRNKRSIAIDLKTSRGTELLKRMVAGANMFVQNFRPGKIEQMGLGESELRKYRPDLVYVSISGFGQSGPYVKKRSYDPIIQALSGLAEIQADRASRRPQMVRVIVADKVAALSAAQAMTAALFHQAKTGHGQHVRLAMLDALVAFLWPEGMARFTFAESSEEPDPDAPDLVFETQDGWITVATNTDVEWRALARAVGHPEWIDDPRFKTPQLRVKNAGERRAMLSRVLKTKPSAHWLSVLEAAEVPCAPVLSRAEMLLDPQVRANELVMNLSHPCAGRIRQARPAARFDRTPASIYRPAPLLGEHTDEVLGELGLSADEIAELRRERVIP